MTVLIGNISVVYFFLSDTFLFDESFTPVELVATVIILTVVFTIAVFKIKEKNKLNKLK